MIETIVSLLKNGKNPALRYQQSASLLRDLAEAIVQAFKNEADFRVHLPFLSVLITDYDYRLVAEYLAALQSQDQHLLALFHQLHGATVPAGQLRHQLAYAHLLRVGAYPSDANVCFVQEPDCLFAPTGEQLVIYLRDERYRASLGALVEAAGAELSRFVEQQADVPGSSAVVRQGLVRAWYLPDGTAVVSKRENPQKRGRFRTEQANHDLLLKRFGRDALTLSDGATTGRRIYLQIAPAFAVIADGYSGARYALSAYVEGDCLEDILLAEEDRTARRRLLRDYRLVLDRLYELGILWGDMSPRNILLHKSADVETYILLDFEKTRLLNNAPVPHAQRIEHCRGQICVEELGVLCPPDEVLTCFDGYFDPSTWDLESDIPLPFLPRPDIAAVLHGRGVRDVTLGAYNRLDRDFISVRTPDIDPITGGQRFPGRLGFKVEHYLSCAGEVDASDYDRKATEVLIASKRHDCFDGVVALLASLTSRLESAFLRAEFTGILNGGFSGQVVPPREEIDQLVHVLDTLYESRDSNRSYLEAVSANHV